MLDSPPSAILIESAIKVVWQENVTMATHNPICCASFKKLAKKGRTRALKNELFCLYRPPVCMSTMVRSKSTAIKLMPAFAIALANRRERWCVFVFFGRFIGVVLCLLRFYCTKLRQVPYPVNPCSFQVYNIVRPCRYERTTVHVVRTCWCVFVFFGRCTCTTYYCTLTLT